jgi:hypothetical protein
LLKGGRGVETLYGDPLGGYFGAGPPKIIFWENFLVKYCNFVVNMNHSSLFAYLTIEVMLGFFSLEENPILCMRELYCGYTLEGILYSKRGYYEKIRGSYSGCGVGCIPSFSR